MKNHRWLLSASVVLSILAAGGCAQHNVKKTEAPAPAKAAATSPPSPIDASEAIVRQDLMHAVDDLKLVHFDYDSDNLRSEDRVILKNNAVWLKSNADAKIQVAGHCDQRGTVEYNLALGQRRAKTVRDYYRKLGIPGKRIATISYGNEKPICQEMQEGCWLQNRRAETLIAFPPNTDTATTK